MKPMSEIDPEAVLKRLRERNQTAYREPKPQGRRQSLATRRKLRAAHLARERQRAEADPDASPLRLARLRAGYSWPTLAEAAGVSLSSVARAERRPELVGPWTWSRLARALEVKAEAIQPR
jgi:hypothetical protein